MDKKRYGYKVCYRETDSTKYARHFLTYTYKQAVDAMHGYIRYPPESREDNHKLNKPTWKIIPVSRAEMKAGIWREVPF